MMRLLVAIDRIATKVLEQVCGLLLALILLFILYTVVMRYYFLNPPMWGDTLSTFSYVWLVLIALPLTVRDSSHIAMNFVITRLPLRYVFLTTLLWNLVIVFIGLVIVVYGFHVAWTNPGKFWQLGYLPKTYILMILPVSGALVVLAAIATIAEDTYRYRCGEFAPAKEYDL